MKKTFAIIIAVLLCATAVVSLAACQFEDEAVEVVFYSSMGQNLANTLQRYITEFNKIYPDIKITHNHTFGEYDSLTERISTELDNFKGPSIAYCYADHVATYNATNQTMALDSFINSKEVVPAGKFGSTEDHTVGFTTDELNDFIDTFYKEGREAFGDGSTMYMLPFAKSSEVMFYNKTFFDANELQVPTHWFATTANVDDDKTSMEYVCKRIKEIDPKSIPFGYDSDDNFFITMCYQLQSMPENADKNLYTSATGKHYLFDNEVVRDCMTKFNEWYQKGYMITKATNGTTYTSDLFKFEDKTIVAKGMRSYMSIGSTGGATYNIPSTDTFTVEVAEVPQMNPEKPQVISQGPSICMLVNENTKTEDQKLASWLFMKFLTTNKQFQASFSMTSGYTPVIESVRTLKNYKEGYLDLPSYLTTEERITAKAVLQCLDQMDAYYTSPAFFGSTRARNEAKTLVPGVLEASATGNKSVTDIINEKFANAISNCEFYAPSGK